MTSPRAHEDILRLRGEGLEPTDEDIVRLHALAAKITNGPETTAACAPRFALVGGFVFWEPTLAAWEWYRFARSVGAGKDETETLAFACAYARNRGAFDALYDQAEAKRAVRKFVREVAATREEVARAVIYCCAGHDDETPDKTPIARRREEAEKARGVEADRFAYVEKLLAQAAAATGLTFDDIMLQTPSRLGSMIYAYYVQAGAELSDGAAKATADYLCTLHNVRERLLAERADNLRDAAADGADRWRNAVDDKRGDDAGADDGDAEPAGESSHAVEYSK